MGNWSDLTALRPLTVPYVTQLGTFPSPWAFLFRDFPDVFSPEYRESARNYAQALAPFRDDPYLVGYFLPNEPLCGFGSFNLAAEMFEANPGTATRRELARWLKDCYRGDAGAWSWAWGRELRSFDQIATDLFHRVAGGAGRPLGVFEFTLNDQPLLGRFDGENYQVGFVDVCHRPYAEFAKAATAAHEALYPVMAGLQPPTDRAAQERPAVK